MKKIGALFVFLFLISFVSADVISINSGGDEELVINPEQYTEGFFFCVPKTCSYMGYNCNNWDNGCGETINCGTCSADFTCSSGICTAVPVTPGEGGGSGGGGVTPSGVVLEVTPEQFNIRMAISTNKQEVIKVTNTGNQKGTISIIQSGLTNKVLIEPTTIELAPGETKEIAVIFVAPSEPGIYTGKIYVGSRAVLVTLNVKTKLLLFDSNIAVLNKDYKVGKLEDLKTKVTLIPMGDEERMDVTLNYVIKDYDGKVYVTQSETVLVEKQVDFKKNFDVGSLPVGSYIVGLELVYSEGVAPSSAHFEVVEQTSERLFGKLIFWLITFILLVFIMIIILLIKRKREERKNK